MSTSALIMMGVMIVCIWGGFFLFLQLAYRREKERKKEEKL